MPFYEYRCGSCGHEFEAMQKMSAAVLTDCPACDGPDLVKLVSAAGFRLKGSGWYETDFKGGNKGKPSESSDASGKDNADSAGKDAAGKNDAAGTPGKGDAAAKADKDASASTGKGSSGSQGSSTGSSSSTSS